MHVTAKFHHPTFNRLEVIVLTNKQTDKQIPAKTSILFHYATTVGKKQCKAVRTMLDTVGKRVSVVMACSKTRITIA